MLAIHSTRSLPTRATRGSAFGAVAAAVMATLIVGCHAPQNLHQQTQFMRMFGEETRSKTGRALGESVIPPEAQPPVVVPIAVNEDEPLGLIAVGDHARIMGEGAAPRPSVDQARAPVRIAVDREQLAEFLRTRHDVGVVDAKAINGRFTNTDNILRVEFIPADRSESVARRDFMLICAVTVGMDREGTVDAVIGLATDPQLLPWMSLRATLADFEAYQSGELTSEQWNQRIETRRL